MGGQLAICHAFFLLNWYFCRFFGFFYRLFIYSLKCKAAERLVEYEKFWLMDGGNNELHFLMHALAELLHFFLPPGNDIEFFEPILYASPGFLPAQAFEPGQVHHLVADCHLFIQTPLFGQVTYPFNKFCMQFFTFEPDLAAVGSRDLINDTDQRGFARAIGAKQAKDTFFRY
jgi:hypothetical protein